MENGQRWPWPGALEPDDGTTALADNDLMR
jgi:hypothetical protein